MRILAWRSPFIAPCATILLHNFASIDSHPAALYTRVSLCASPCNNSTKRIAVLRYVSRSAWCWFGFSTRPQSPWQRNSLSLFTNRSFTHTPAHGLEGNDNKTFQWKWVIVPVLVSHHWRPSHRSPRLCSNFFRHPFHFSGWSRWTCAIKVTTHIHLHSATFSCFLSLTIQRCFLVLAFSRSSSLLLPLFIFRLLRSDSTLVAVVVYATRKSGKREKTERVALSENWSRNKENRGEKFSGNCEQRQGLWCRSGSAHGSFVCRNLQRFMAATLFQCSLFVVFAVNCGFCRYLTFNWFGIEE